MRKANRTEPVDALGKIQALAAAAGYLISTERETQLCFEHRCLKDCFEVECIKKYGRASSQSLLESTYQGMLNKDNTKLTPEGIEFMSSLMANAVEIALKDPKGNHFGLEMY